VEDLLDYSADVSVFLGVVDVAEFDCSLAGADMSLENRGFTLTLCLLVSVDEVLVDANDDDTDVCASAYALFTVVTSHHDRMVIMSIRQKRTAEIVM